MAKRTRRPQAQKVRRPRYTETLDGEMIAPTYTREQINAKGNPFDVPWELVQEAAFRAGKRRCYRCGSGSNFNRVERIDVWGVDCVDNLRVVCNKHSEDQ